jgi:hypothetical protein
MPPRSRSIRIKDFSPPRSQVCSCFHVFFYCCYFITCPSSVTVNPSTADSPLPYPKEDSLPTVPRGGIKSGSFSSPPKYAPQVSRTKVNAFAEYVERKRAGGKAGLFKDVTPPPELANLKLLEDVESPYLVYVFVSMIFWSRLIDILPSLILVFPLMLVEFTMRIFRTLCWPISILDCHSCRAWIL